MQAKSERNKINRKKQTTKHLCGSKSFAEVEESLVEMHLFQPSYTSIIFF